MRTQPPVLIGFVSILLAACSGGDDGGPRREHVVALDPMSACSASGDAASCDGIAGCTWVGIEACGAESCPDGACIAIDPCASNDDRDSCLGDVADGCDWAEVDRLCPAGETCDGGGFCYQRGDDDGYVCLCPLSPCVEFDDGTFECPACECDGPDGCEEPPTCTCPGCPDGEECPACDCASGGGVGGGDSGEPGGASAPEQVDGCSLHDEAACLTDAACDWVGIEACSPDFCPGGVCVEKQSIDPCTGYLDAVSCAAGGDQCRWTEACVDLECPPGATCPDCSGSCHAALPDDQGCVCVCPLSPCVEGDDGSVVCPPCDCTCDGGGTGCVLPAP